MNSWLFLLFCIHVTQIQKDREVKTIFDDAQNLFIAHRGLTSLHLENTLQALTSAFDHKADGVEFDVQLSKDMVPMVFHDRELKRLVNIDANVDDLLFTELKNLRQTSKAYNLSYPISTLEEVLGNMPENKLINIELKETTLMRGQDGMREVLKVIENFKNKLSIVISSFDPEILELVSKLDSSYALGLLIDKELRLKDYLNNNNILSRVDFLNPHINLINKTTSKLIKKMGIKLILWGHKEMGQELNFIADKHTALISDIPEELIKRYKHISN